MQAISQNRTRARAAGLELLHASVPGRARFKAPALYRERFLSEELRGLLSSKEHVQRVSVSPLTSTILIQYDPNKADIRGISSELSKELKSLLREGARRAAGAGPAAGAAHVKPWHRMSPQEVARELRSSGERGLSSREARSRRRKFGRNELPRPAGVSDWTVLMKQFSSSPTLLLLGSAAVSLITGGLADAVVILGVVGINSWIGYLTEASAEKRVSNLALDRRPFVSVIRDGRPMRVRSPELVPGDLLMLTPGTWIPADARLIQTNLLNVDESILTGESLPARKSEHASPGARKSADRNRRPALADLENLVFRGTAVTGGSGQALVVGTGASTEIGRIESLMGEAAQPETPLQAQLRHLGNQLVVAAFGLSATAFFLGVLRGQNWLEMLKVSGSLALAAIPESLPTIATTTLARGVQALEKDGVLVRSLEAIETLGGIDTLCLDKTGTLTLNRMKVTAIRAGRRRFHAVLDDGIIVNGVNGGRKRAREADPDQYPALKKTAEIVSLCNEARLPRKPGPGKPGEGAQEEVRGSATEQALLELAILAKVDPERLRASLPAEAIRYRTESRGYMFTIHRLSDGRRLIAMKGRPGEVLRLCDRFMDDDGSIRPLDRRQRDEILERNLELAARSLRVLGVAYRDSETGANATNLIWLGLVGMEDPLRPGVHTWIEQMRDAGIRPVMITGDQTGTAKAIGKAVGISGKEPLCVIDSRELDFHDRKRLLEQARRAHVFARVSPSDKLKIVQALQRTGQRVAMVGDGINDGPALKIADVGVALTSPGMEVTAQVADMVLVRNEIGKLSRALLEGRRVQSNIRKAVDYILTQNASEILFTLLSVAAGSGEPLTPMQLLWINLVTDIFPELALAQEPAEEDALRRPPQHAGNRFLAPAEIRRILTEGGILSLSSLAAFFSSRRRHGETPESRTVAFLALISSSLLYTLSARSEAPTLFAKSRMPRNPYIPWALEAGFLAEGVAVTLPALKSILGTGTRKFCGADLLWTVLGSVAPLLLIETTKIVRSNQQEAA